MNPELQAAALDATAAQARAQAAGELPDPVARLEVEDIERRRGSLLPEGARDLTWTVEQEFPLWGKRELRRDIARKEAEVLRYERRSAEAELVALVKSTFADLYAAHRALRIERDVARTLNQIADTAGTRYAFGLGSQQDALMAQVEQEELAVGLVRREAEVQAVEARLNTFLNRQPEAPLAEPRALPPVPDTSVPVSELLERARTTNPTVAAATTRLVIGPLERRLVRRSWYPDLTLGASVVQRDGRLSGYEAMIAVNLPLRWDRRRSEARAAAADTAARQARAEAARRNVEGSLAATWRQLDGARRAADILHARHLPQVRLTLESAIAAFETDQGSLLEVLSAERALRRLELEYLGLQAEQQRLLAEIERLIGSEL